MNPDAAAKQRLRADATMRLSVLDEATMATASEAIVGHLIDSPELHVATGFATFAAWRQEPDLRALTDWALAEGKQVYYPRYDRADGCYRLGRVDAFADLVVGHHGIREPAASAAQPDEESRRELVWLVPGLAFDVAGRRLGRGAGDYDRLLADVTGPRIGVAFVVQLRASLPSEPHDVPMHAVVSELGVVTVDSTIFRAT